MSTKKRLVILIGGGPTAGKSTLAAKLAKRLQLPWIPADTICDIMRMVAEKKKHPLLFNANGLNAEGFLTKFSARQIAAMKMKQAEAVWPAIKELVADDYHYTDGLIIEGVNIVPRLVAKDFARNKSVRVVFLIDNDVSRVRKTIFTRGLWDYAHTYPDQVKNKEVEWVMRFNELLKYEAKKFGFPCIEAAKTKQDFETILKTIQAH